jgi:signal transduction histidine kinase
MHGTLHTLLSEPRAPGASDPLRGDWLLVAVVVIAALTEGVVNRSMTWPWLSAPLTAALGFTLPWRRVHPLAMVAVAFGATGVVHLASGVLGVRWDGPATGIFLLILPYALLRWGAGREAVLGLAVIALSFASSMWSSGHAWGEVLGASLFLLFPAALGASVRYRDSAARRAREQDRLHEREQLARELHDSVAHHVSAIAVQAQAGRALAATRPEAPAEALALIEEAASRTLSDMRRIVGALRGDGDTPALAPAARLEDLRRLEGTAGAAHVRVSLDGSLDDLDAALQATLFRLAQEAVTNAQRHARGASNVQVNVATDPTQVHLTVEDDGQPVRAPVVPGFGLRGMTERATLLGGTLRAGPGETRGWTVEAVLPRHASGT